MCVSFGEYEPIFWLRDVDPDSTAPHIDPFEYLKEPSEDIYDDSDGEPIK